MTQVMTNLVINAIKYTPKAARWGHPPAKAGGEGRKPARARRDLHSSNSGIGISEHLPYLFQPFFRVDENTKGTGLGLSIARDIVELHQGRIENEKQAQHRHLVPRLSGANRRQYERTVRFPAGI